MSNELYSDYLGEGYCNKVRKILGVDDKICTNLMINSSTVIGGMKMILAPYLSGKSITNLAINKVNVKNEADYIIFQEAALYALAAVLCSPIGSRAKKVPFLGRRYQRNWKNKQARLLQRVSRTLQALMVKK